MWDYMLKKVFPSKPESTGYNYPPPKKIPALDSGTQAVDTNFENVPKDESRTGYAPKERRLQCPVCRTPMMKENIRGVSIDRCPSCGGVFLDRGELAILSKSTYLPKDNSDAPILYTPHGIDRGEGL